MSALKLAGKNLSATTRSLKRLCSTIRSALRACTKPVQLSPSRPIPMAGHAYYEPTGNLVEKRFEPVYVDELVCRYVASHEAGSSSKRVNHTETEFGSGKASPRNDLGSGMKVGTVTAWGENADQQAEEFIQRFREELRLEREKSMEEFAEMLAPGAR